MHSVPPRRTRAWATLAVLVISPIALTGCLPGSSSDEAEGPHLKLTAAIPDSGAKKTVLRVGDPYTQVALQMSGLGKNLPIKIQWANISGGPETLQAFRADAIDVGSVSDIPPLFAQWSGTDVKIIAARYTKDPLDHPVYEIGIAPGPDVKTLADIKGKKIAYSPGHAQGALVLKLLKKLGLSKNDVDLVEMESVDDVYVNALGSGQVDVAPLGQALVPPLMSKYGKDGAHTLSPGIRDDAWHLYTPTDVLQDAHKAAALKQYVAVWGKAQRWINAHPDEYAKGYYVQHEGLSPSDADYIVKALGKYTVPADWSSAIAREQKTVNLLVKEQGHPPLDLTKLNDHRFEGVGADPTGAAAESGAKSGEMSGEKSGAKSGATTSGAAKSDASAKAGGAKKGS